MATIFLYIVSIVRWKHGSFFIFVLCCFFFHRLDVMNSLLLTHDLARSKHCNEPSDHIKLTIKYYLLCKMAIFFVWQ